MSFKDELKKVRFSVAGRNFEAIGASFRGWPFFVDTSTISSGRRIVTHEFPGRNQPLNQDQGKKARSYSLEGYVLGNDYLTQKQNLKQALEANGPGELIHPYFGNMRGVIESYSITETKNEGAFALFSINFIEDEPFVEGPLDSVKREKIVLDSALELGNQAQTFFEESPNIGEERGFSVGGLAQEFVNEVNAAVGDAIDLIEEGKTQARAVAQFADSINRIKVNLDILLADAENLGKDIRALVNIEVNTSSNEDTLIRSGAVETFDNKAAISENLTIVNGANEADVENPEGTTPQSTQASNNIKILNQFLQAVAFESAANEVVLSSFLSVEDAENTREQMASAFEAFLETVIDDEVYQKTQNLQSAIDRFLDDAAANLRNIVEFKPVADIPSLNLSWDLYETQSGEQDIIDRNKIRNPLFVPVVELEVLTRE